MRLWSIHPSFLDNKGLVAVWREALLAQKVLTGTTKGYRNHPQLHRFKQSDNPMALIGTYLHCVYLEAIERNYSFNQKLILIPPETQHFTKITVTTGQLKYETEHLLKKLQSRDKELWSKWKEEAVLGVHPMFEVVDGEVESWEIVDIVVPKKKGASRKRKTVVASQDTEVLKGIAELAVEAPPRRSARRKTIVHRV